MSEKGPIVFMSGEFVPAERVHVSIYNVGIVLGATVTTSTKAVILTLLSIALCLPLCRAEDRSGWDALGLQMEAIEGATVYYEPSLADEVQTLKEVYAEILAEQAVIAKQRDAMIEKSAQIIDDINRIAGATVTDEQKENQTRIFRFFLFTSLPSSVVGNR